VLVFRAAPGYERAGAAARSAAGLAQAGDGSTRGKAPTSPSSCRAPAPTGDRRTALRSRPGGRRRPAPHPSTARLPPPSDGFVPVADLLLPSRRFSPDRAARAHSGPLGCNARATPAANRPFPPPNLTGGPRRHAPPPADVVIDRYIWLDTAPTRPGGPPTPWGKAGPTSASSYADVGAGQQPACASASSNAGATTLTVKDNVQPSPLRLDGRASPGRGALFGPTPVTSPSTANVSAAAFETTLGDSGAPAASPGAVRPTSAHAPTATAVDRAGCGGGTGHGAPPQPSSRRPTGRWWGGRPPRRAQRPGDGSQGPQRRMAGRGAATLLVHVAPRPLVGGCVVAAAAPNFGQPDHRGAAEGWPGGGRAQLEALGGRARSSWASTRSSTWRPNGGRVAAAERPRGGRGRRRAAGGLVDPRGARSSDVNPFALVAAQRWRRRPCGGKWQMGNGAAGGRRSVRAGPPRRWRSVARRRRTAAAAAGLTPPTGRQRADDSLSLKLVAGGRAAGGAGKLLQHRRAWSRSRRAPSRAGATPALTVGPRTY